MNSDKRAEMSYLKLIILVSILLRVAAALYLGNEVVSLPGTADQVSYNNLSLRVLDGHGFSFGKTWWPVTAADAPTAHWSFLYTFYLVGVYLVFGPYPLVARLIQAVAVGFLQPYLAYRLADEIRQSYGPARGPGEEGRAIRLKKPSLSAATLAKAPLFAAAFTAIYIYFVYYAATLMTEPFYLCAVLASLWLAVVLGKQVGTPHAWKTAIGLGLALSATVLFRQLFLIFVAFAFLWLILYQRPRTWRRTLASIGIVVVLIAATIAPFAAYNYLRFHQFVLLNTNAGYAFYLANHPAYGDRFESASEMSGAYDELIPVELRHMNEAALDRALLKQGFQFVLQDPIRYLKLSASRVPHYFKFWFDADSSVISNVSRIGSFGIFLPFMLFGLLLPLVHFDRSPKRTFSITVPPASVVLLYLFVLVYTSIHLLSWAQVRYRMPVDAVLIIFAGLSAAEIFEVIRKFGRQLKPGQLEQV